ncbi:hypothetical protein [Actinomadura chokoriensis]|uniref:hypothetical protein n=1 Tax=Actinomadura chokoriensis TaxID=454156 RepID=UPI0031FA3956
MSGGGAGSGGVRRWYLVAGVLVLVLGAVVASQVGALLRVEVAPAAVPSERAMAAKVAPVVEPPRLGAILLPKGATDVERRRERLAAAAVASALAGRGLPKPEVGAGEAEGAALRIARVDSLLAPSGREEEAFRLRRRGGGLLLEAATAGGVANGLYAVADRIRSGAEVLPKEEDGRVVAPTGSQRPPTWSWCSVPGCSSPSSCAG